MRIITLYITCKFLKIFIIMVMIFVTIYSLFDFLEKIHNFREVNVETMIILSFFIKQIPEIISLMIPLAVLISTVITLGIMDKHNEILAINSSGVSIWRFTFPIFLISLCLTVIVLLINEIVVPKVKVRNNFIWENLVEEGCNQVVCKKKVWYRGHNSIYCMMLLDQIGQSLIDLVYYNFDHDFNLSLRIDACRAFFLNGHWYFFFGLQQERLFDGSYKVGYFEDQIIELPEIPYDFSQISKPSEEMSFTELIRHVHKIEKEGYESRCYYVDLQNKISFPFITVIMFFLGVPLILFKKKNGSIALSILIGLSCSLFYWIIASYTRFFVGYSGILSPFLSAWLPNIIFLISSLYFFIRLRY